MSAILYAIATMDTKGEEIAYLAQCARATGIQVATVDVGTQSPPVVAPDIARERVAACHPQGAGATTGNSDRGLAVAAMSEALLAFLRQEHAAGRVAGVVGIGGSGGTALLAPAFRALPVGLPKLIVSTVASGNTAAYVGESDLILCPSIVDVAGLNRVSRAVLGNAAHAIAGMVRQEVPAGDARPALGLTMFGVTTACVTLVRQALEAKGNDALVFHATGTGGRAMEALARSGLLGGLLDLTTTEVADQVAGGIWPCGEGRFGVLAQRPLPCVLSLGACDMVNFAAKDTVPERYRQRRLHVHNANVTLMRTTVAENEAIAAFIAARIMRAIGPVTVLIPERGVSALDAPGQAFHDPEADAALFAALERGITQSATRRIVRLPLHINDPAFAAAVLDAWTAISSPAPTTR